MGGAHQKVDGYIDDKYQLVELSSSSYPARTKRNIRKSDDEPYILSCIQRILQLVNYDVITATSGVQAWALFEQRQPEIDLYSLTS